MRRINLPRPIHLLFLIVLLSAFSLTSPRAQDDAQPAEDWEVITAENAHRLERIGTIGTGRLTGSAWSPRGDLIAYTTPVGVWVISRPDNKITQIMAVDDAHYPLFSRDGALLAWVTDDDEANTSTVFVWDTLTQEMVLEIRPDGALTQQLVFSENGQTLYIGGTDGTLSVWAFPSGELIRSAQIERNTPAFWGFEVLSDGAYIINKDDEVWRYDADIRPVNRIFEFGWAALHPDGQRLAVMEYTNGEGHSQLRLYDLDTLSMILASDYETIGILKTLRWDASGRYLIFPAITGTGVTWDSEANTYTHLFLYGEADWSACVQCSDPNGTVVLTSQNGSMRDHGRVMLEVRDIATQQVYERVVMSQTQRVVLCTSTLIPNLIEQLNTDAQNMAWCGDSLNIPAPVYDRDFSAHLLISHPAGVLVALTNSAYTTFVWNRESGELTAQHEGGPTDTFSSPPSFSADGRWLTMAMVDGFLIADMRNHEIVARIEGEYAPVFHDDNILLTRTLVSNEDNLGSTSLLRAYALDVTDAVPSIELSLLAEISLGESRLLAMTVAPSGDQISAVTETDVHVISFDGETFETQRIFPAFADYSVPAVQYTVDGSALIYVTNDPSARLLIQDTVRGNIPFERDSGYGILFTLSEDGRYLLTGAYSEGIVEVWAVPSGD